LYKIEKKDLDKPLSQCPFFFRPESPLRNRPNIRPLGVFHSELSPQDTAQAAERLIAVMGGASGIDREKGKGESNIRERNMRREIGGPSRRGKEREREVDIPEVVE